MQFLKTFSLILLTIVFIAFAYTQEFPIAVGRDTTLCGGGAFDGTNFMLSILGDTVSSNSITAQLVSKEGNLVGSRISLGATGGLPKVAFDGTNYLVVWGDAFPIFNDSDSYGTGDLHARFVSTSGEPVGAAFVMAENINLKFSTGRGLVTFRDSTYLIMYEKGGNHIDYLYGRRINRSGALVGNEFQISNTYARETAMEFDGTNYLVTWVYGGENENGKYIYGRFVSPSGVLVGDSFLIDGSDAASDNPVATAFDGTWFMVMFHDQAVGGGWNIMARFVTPAGEVAPERIMLIDSTMHAGGPSIVSNGTRYMVSWMETGESIKMKGRLFNFSGSPIDTAFTVFETVGGRVPFGGVGGVAGDEYFFVVNRLDLNFSDGDIYGMFLRLPATGVRDDAMNLAPKSAMLLQNYPNPFNPVTNIQYFLPVQSHVRVTVYDMLGREIETLVNGMESPGYKSVRFDGSSLPSGVYFYRLEAGKFTDVRKLLLMK